MTSIRHRPLAACLGATALAVLLVAGPAHAEPVSGDEALIVNPALTELAESGAAPGSAEGEAASGLSTDGASALVVDDAARVLVGVVFADDDALQAGLAAVTGLGEIARTARSAPEVFVSVAPSRFDDLAAIPGVVEVSPALSGVTSDTPALGGPAADAPDVAATAAPSCRSIPSDVDSALGNAGVREKFGVDGTGVVVGILSDSFAGAPHALTTPAQDVAAGALPGPGNPCGYETAVRVLVDDTTGQGSDEGRAMAQIIHSAAPGATLLFAAAGPGQSTLADSVRMLHEAGATVIVDDVWFPEETLWQRGLVATAIAEANDDGVTLLSSAGNATSIGTLGDEPGQSIGSWETTAFHPMTCPTAVLDIVDRWSPTGTIDCADMSGGTDQPRATLALTAATAEKGGTLMTQWSEPMYGLTTMIVPLLLDHATGTLVNLPVQADRDTPSISVSVPVRASADYDLVLVRERMDPATATPDAELRVKWKTSGLSLSALQDTTSPDVVVGPTVWAHAGDPATIAVAAASVLDTSQLEDFSSSGPSTYLFEPVHADRTPSPRYPSPLTLFKPQITGVDGEQTTFFGQNSTEQPDVWRFYGTSAAAPSVAAVAALAQAAAPQATADEIRQQMILTADDVSANEAYAGATTPAWIGAGLVDPDGLLAALVGPSPAPPGPSPAPVPVPAAAGGDRLADTGAAPELPWALVGVLALGVGIAIGQRRRRLRSTR
ncbi:S8 family serine peptidase [Cnuibacter physcomitrellae]|uniref:S8 family serine peptidase n=1 Tax=Cnuibacter physcomitrellae TaxID=1619308 RepID=UPI002175D0A6|nr:S8 family serine peptidase [Cnuibacter physcomitrellae]MCS5495917.1 S8 family serine peptidase [Cnuibacter physcomitrellae]